MTVEEFERLIACRVPTPAELLEGVRAVGWRVRIDEATGRPVLLCQPKDPLAKPLAKLAGRQPYLTELVRLLRASQPGTSSQPAGESSEASREWLWRYGHRYEGKHPANWHPAGAWWVRPAGETQWQRTPAGEQHGGEHEPASSREEGGGRSGVESGTGAADPDGGPERGATAGTSS